MYFQGWWKLTAKGSLFLALKVSRCQLAMFENWLEGRCHVHMGSEQGCKTTMLAEEWREREKSRGTRTGPWRRAEVTRVTGLGKQHGTHIWNSPVTWLGDIEILIDQDPLASGSIAIVSSLDKWEQPKTGLSGTVWLQNSFCPWSRNPVLLPRDSVGNEVKK